MARLKTVLVPLVGGTPSLGLTTPVLEVLQTPTSPLFFQRKNFFISKLVIAGSMTNKPEAQVYLFSL